MISVGILAEWPTLKSAMQQAIKNIVENYAMLSQAGSFVELLFISSLHYPMRNSSVG